jgi:hypothetical protein
MPSVRTKIEVRRSVFRKRPVLELETSQCSYKYRFAPRAVEHGKFQHVADVKRMGVYGMAAVISFDATLSTPLESTLFTT